MNSHHSLPILPFITHLNGRFVRLESFEMAKHLDAICHIGLAEETAERYRYLPMYAPKTREEVRENMGKMVEVKRYMYIIFDQQTNDPVGYLVLLNARIEDAAIEIGIYFMSCLSRTPGGTEALYLLMKHVFDGLGYKRYAIF